MTDRPVFLVLMSLHEKKEINMLFIYLFFCIKENEPKNEQIVHHDNADQKQKEAATT